MGEYGKFARILFLYVETDSFWNAFSVDKK